jgi:hypothetical protein
MTFDGRWSRQQWQQSGPSHVGMCDCGGGKSDAMKVSLIAQCERIKCQVELIF